MSVERPAPLVEVTRGSTVESRHRGHLCAVDGGGRLVAHLGDAGFVTFLRSASKPHQTLPLVASGAADRFRLTDQEVAVACGSHNGEPAHTSVVLSLLRKTGFGPGDLRCGAHEPYSEDEARALAERGERPAALHTNCSGKHAAMLALAKHLGAPPGDYADAAHPVQREMARVVARFADASVEDLAVGTDGCGVPTFALPLRATALAAARLVVPPVEWPDELKLACRRVVASMTAWPEMVEGAGQLDTELMRRTEGRLASKVGAEGVYTAAVLPCERWPRGLGLAFKIEDGDKKDRARSPVAVEALRQLGVLGDADVSALARFARSSVTNHRGETVGEVRAAFELEKP